MQSEDVLTDARSPEHSNIGSDASHHSLCMEYLRM
jgi:hypothetical protein